MVQTNETLHVCVKYPEHRPMARRIYGNDRVIKEIKRNSKCCNDCLMFPDLLKYVGVTSTDVIVRNKDKFKAEGIKTNYVPYREGNNNLVKVVYHEVHNLSVDEFFKPPKKNKRWVD